jgi:hypothetical protein
MDLHFICVMVTLGKGIASDLSRWMSTPDSVFNVASGVLPERTGVVLTLYWTVREIGVWVLGLDLLFDVDSIDLQNYLYINNN